MNTTKLKRLVLVTIKELLWEKAASGMVTIQSLYDLLKKKYGDIKPELIQGVFDNLLELGLIWTGHPQGDDTMYCKLTPQGIDYLDSNKDKQITRLTAIVGAITGILALIISLLGLLIKD